MNSKKKMSGDLLSFQKEALGFELEFSGSP